jgi:hypothetical protein
MKSTIFIVLILFGVKQLSAQNLTSNSNLNITQKLDTVHYNVQSFSVSQSASIITLLKKMEGFSTGSDNILNYQGKPVNFIRVNGKHYDGMDITSIINKLPVAAIDNVEIINDNNPPEALINTKSSHSQQVLNINMKKNIMIDIPSFTHVSAETDEYQPRVYLRTDDFGRPRLRHTDQFNISDRTETDRLITRQIERLQADIATQGKDVDEYGDQIPHFLIRSIWGPNWRGKTVK